MRRDHAIALLRAYGYLIEKEVLAEYKTRFRHEETHAIIDVWMSRKGVTVGLYNPTTKGMWYKRNANITALEDGIITQRKLYELKHD